MVMADQGLARRVAFGFLHELLKRVRVTCLALTDTIQKLNNRIIHPVQCNVFARRHSRCAGVWHGVRVQQAY
jgi:hypothetical protein